MSPLIINLRDATLIAVLLTIPIVAEAWWLMAQMSSSQLPSNYCNAMPGLSRRQRQICYTHPDATRVLHTGLQEAFKECPHQFQHERWNCSMGFDGQTLQRIGTKEAAYIYSLSAGGASYAIARACAQGLIADCGCGDVAARVDRMRRRVPLTPYDEYPPYGGGKTPMGGGTTRGTSYDHYSDGFSSGSYASHFQQTPQSSSMSAPDVSGVQSSSTKEFTWAGCSDNVKYGNAFSRKFIDATEKESGLVKMDARARMNLHNNRVGRKVLASNQRRQCKCHGVSGSCVTKTCWLSVPPFDEYATILKKKYQRAQHVTVAADRSDLVVVSNNNKEGAGRNARNGRHLRGETKLSVLTPANRGDLVYLDPSPNYCVADPTNEISGTSDRECFSAEKCSDLCCGRGWNTQREWRQEPCKCKFIWCCDVKCESCIREVERFFCK